MTIYITQEGARYRAATPAQLVHQLRRDDAYAASRSDAEFMHELAARMKLQKRNAVIPTDDVAKFVAALISMGFVSEETSNADNQD